MASILTLAQANTLALDRIRLNNTSTSNKDRMRQYLNVAAVRIANLTKWWWLNRTTTFKTTRTLTVTSGSGTYTSGETVTDGASYSATVDGYDATKGELYVYSENTETPTGTLTGGSSGATSTYASRAFTRVYTPVSTGVTAWWSATDVTNERPLSIVGPDQYDAIDEDRTEEGNVTALFIGGVNTTTGAPEIELYRVPSTTNTTIRVRHDISIIQWSSSNDLSSLQVLGIPQVLEMAVVTGGSYLYLKQLHHDRKAADEKNEYDEWVELALRQNVRMQGNRRYEALPTNQVSLYQVGTGIVTDGTR
tara:strand:- start:7594 stop:8514 length:921 start_codon:yes stop_codon:yes gene_type:complete